MNIAFTNRTLRLVETLDFPTTQKNEKPIVFTMKIKNIKFPTISTPPRAAPGDAQIGREASGEQNQLNSL